MSRIRPYAPHDHPEWIRMRTALWPDQTATEAVAWLARSDAVVLVVEREPAGLCGFAEAGARSWAEGCASSPVAYLEGWYVDPDSRRRGIGARLLEAVEAWAKAAGYRELGSDATLENDVSRSAHGRLGFAEVERLAHYRKEL